jgi:phosphatidylserine/phosphatidylglycerophosphate/cardiolipin synthase-like enzyme
LIHVNGSSHLIFHGPERRQFIVDTCRSARRYLILSIFRCDDFGIIDELAAAVQRGVSVRALISRDARGWKKRLQRLAELLESAGAEVYRYRGPFPKYHAKYLVADDSIAVISSSNLTHKCFKETCDFLFGTSDAGIIGAIKNLFEHDCGGAVALAPSPEHLIVGPEATRERFTQLLERAKASIWIMDHRVTDSAVLEVIEARKKAGVKVTILGRGVIDGMMSHGKMLVIDGHVGCIGSVALSRASLDSRREVAIMIEEPKLVTELVRFFEHCSARHIVHDKSNAADIDDDDDEAEDVSDEVE